jgi:hypothetical protein
MLPACHVIQHIVNPYFLSQIASNDVAGARGIGVLGKAWQILPATSSSAL